MTRTEAEDIYGGLAEVTQQAIGEAISEVIGPLEGRLQTLERQLHAWQQIEAIIDRKVRPMILRMLLEAMDRKSERRRADGASDEDDSACRAAELEINLEVLDEALTTVRRMLWSQADGDSTMTTTERDEFRDESADAFLRAFLQRVVASLDDRPPTTTEHWFKLPDGQWVRKRAYDAVAEARALNHTIRVDRATGTVTVTPPCSDALAARLSAPWHCVRILTE